MWLHKCHSHTFSATACIIMHASCTADRLQAGTLGACSLMNLEVFQELSEQQHWVFTEKQGMYPEKDKYGYPTYFKARGGDFYDSSLVRWYSNLNNSMAMFLVSLRTSKNTYSRFQ